MRRVRKQKNIIIMVVMLALFIMVSGYAIYQKKLDIGGVANIDWKDWNIRILSIDTVDSSSGVDVVKPSHTNTTAKFNSKITKVGGFIKYKIVVKNSGTIDGVLGTINISESEDSVITYTIEGEEIDDELLAGEERTIYVTATYDSSKVDTASSNKSNVSINLNYVQLEGYVYQNRGYLATRSGDEDYWISEKLPSNSIESISFTTSKEIPSDVGDNYFDASQEQNGSIMGWFYDSDADGLYEVYVGQEDGVMANPNSAYLFMNIENLTSVDVDNLNTSEVTEMALMFANNYYITSLDLSSWDTSNVESMTSMFGSCEGLQSINVLGWDTSKVLYMDNMFYNLPELKEIDLSTWDTSSVYYMNYMFYSNYSLETIYVSDLWSIASVGASYDMFTNATSLVGAVAYSESNANDATFANYLTGYLTNPNYTPPLSENYLLAREQYSSYWLNSNLANDSIESITFTASNTVPSDVGNNYFDASAQNNGSIMAWYYDTDSDGLYEVTVGQSNGVRANPDSYQLFYGLTNLTKLNLNKLITTKVTRMGYMFYNTPSLTSVNVSNFDTSLVTSLYGMFWDSGVTSLDINDWDVSLVESMDYMFYNSKLSTLDLSNWNTSSLLYVNNMFNNASKLTSLKIDNFNTSKVTDMYNMFSNMTKITSLDLSSFDTSKVQNYFAMFQNSSSLKTIYVSDKWVLNSGIYDSNDMFTGCSSIVGGSGTAYDSSKVDSTMANYQTGYFTYKAA